MSRKNQKTSPKDNRKLFIFVSLVILGGVGILIAPKDGGTPGKPVADKPSPQPKVSPRASPTGGFGASMGSAPEPRRTEPDGVSESGKTATPSATSEKETPADRPKPVLLADGKVRTLMAPGETLVTGGYLNSEGKWEFTMVTAQLVEGGKEKLLKISSSVIALDESGVTRAGLGTLVTGEIETRQHGEVWGEGEAQRILKELQETKGTELLSSPTIVMQGGREGSVQIGTEGGFLLQFGIKADLLPDGNLDLTVSHKRQAPGK